jgi:transglutaminase-like putative cysteine protease
MWHKAGMHLRAWAARALAPAVFFALAYAVLVPVGFWAATRSSLALPLLLSLVLLLALLQILRVTTLGAAKIVFGITGFVVTAVYGLSVLVGLVITPFSSYSLWFEAMADGGTGTGTVSNLFTLLAAFFSTTLGATFVTMGFVWPLLITGLFVSALIAVILQAPIYYAITITVGFFCLFYLLMRGQGRAFLGRRIGYLGGFFAVVLLAARLLAGDQNASGSRIIDQSIHPTLRQTVSSALPQFPLLYGIPGYGIAFDERSLGGAPVLSPLPIFTVQAEVDGPLYLKTDVFDYYDGKTWRSTVDSDTPKSNAASRVASAAALDEMPLLRGRPRRAPTAVRVEMLLDFYAKLPYTLDAEAFHFVGLRPPKLISGAADRGFKLATPLVAGDVVYITRGGNGGAVPAPVRELSAAELQRYLQLPRSLGRTVSDIGNAFVDTAASRRQILHAIDDHLSATCTYSLNIDNLRRSENFLEKFLVGERKGYCVHFATAFVTFARMNDIPARYNSGFLINFPGTSDTAQVTGLAAHSWAEVWLPEKGWIRWEATPAVDPAIYSDSDLFFDDFMMDIYGFEMELDAATLRQIQSILGDREIQPGEPVALSAEQVATRASSRRTLGLVAMGAVAGALLLLITWGQLRWLRIPTARRRIARGAQRLATAGRWFGIADPRITGWQAWREQVASLLGSRRGARRTARIARIASTAARLLQTALYAGRQLQDREIRVLRRAFRRMWRYRLLRV